MLLGYSPKASHKELLCFLVLRSMSLEISLVSKGMVTWERPGDAEHLRVMESELAFQPNINTGPWPPG